MCYSGGSHPATATKAWCWNSEHDGGRAIVGTDFFSNR